MAQCLENKVKNKPDIRLKQCEPKNIWKMLLNGDKGKTISNIFCSTAVLFVCHLRDLLNCL